LAWLGRSAGCSPAVTRTGRLDPTVLHAACRSARSAAGFGQRVTVLTLRHSFADASAGERADVDVYIQVLLGHASLPARRAILRVATKTIQQHTPSRFDRLRWRLCRPAEAGTMAPVLEVADVFRRHGEAFRQARGGHLGLRRAAVWAPSRRAGRRRFGGHVEQCDNAAKLTLSPNNSCRKRHCPK